LYQKYRTLADETPGVHFVGRLATYKYYNMDQIVAQALTTYAKMVNTRRKEATILGQIGMKGNGKHQLPAVQIVVS
jgi:UDP-galactopyranose mutase